MPISRPYILNPFPLRHKPLKLSDAPNHKKRKLKTEPNHGSNEEEEEIVKQSRDSDDSDEEEKSRPWHRRKLRSFLKTPLQETDELPPITGSLSRLPEKIIMDILARLPLESLYSSRLVSKFWYFLIRHPRFAKFHLNSLLDCKNVSPYAIFMDKRNGGYYIAGHLDDPKREFRLYSARFEHDKGMIEISSCNGLILSHEAPFDLANPITRECITLNEHPRVLKRPASVTAFGFDGVEKEYKIIRVLEKMRKGLGTDAEMLNLSTGAWWLVRDLPFTFKGKQSSVFFNGAFHWIAYENGKASGKNVVIVTFKIGTEEFGKIKMPTGLGKLTKKFDHYLVVLGECLCFVHTVADEHVEIWVMKKYGKQRSWVKKYVIRNLVMNTDDFILERCLDPMVDIEIHHFHDCCRKPYLPIQLLKNGEILLLCSHRNFGYYNPSTGAIRCEKIRGTESMRYSLHPVVHMASLISPRSIF